MKRKQFLTVMLSAVMAFTMTAVAMPAIVADAASTGKVPMFRLYNPNSGEHFYTKSSSERDDLKRAGWKDEGEGWTAPEFSNTPVYRLYNPNAGDHHYTTAMTERNNLISAGWRSEGIGWYSDDEKKVPVYREYNPNAVTGTHNYTPNKSEHDTLISAGWKDEGIGWYGVPAQGEGVIDDIALNSISLSETSLDLTVGNTKSLRVTYEPADYNGDRTVTWTTSDPSVASVKDGVVTAVSEGEATITASVNGKIAECDVYVEAKIVHVSYITLSDFSLEMTAGDSYTITAEIHPENYNVPDTLTWTSADETVAKVDQNGQVEAVGPGQTEITASIDGASDSCRVHVKAKTEEFTLGDTWTVPNQWRFRVDSVERHYACNNYSPKTGEEVVIINYTYWNDGYEGSKMNLCFSSANFNVYDSTGAAAENYPCTHEVSAKELIKGTYCSASQAYILKNAGSPITLYVSERTYTDGNSGEEMSAIFKLDMAGGVSDISLSPDSLEMTVGDSSIITAQIYPEDYDGSGTLTWASADETVAKVDQNGQVEAVGPGQTQITASIDGISRSCSVQVKAKIPEFSIGETWTVPNQWRFRVDSVEKHYDCNPYNSRTGEEVVIIHYTYWNDGYEGLFQKNLFFSSVSFDVYDSTGLAAEKYPCTHEAFPKEEIKGASCSASEAYILKKSGSPITLYVSYFTSTNGKAGKEESAIFKLDIGS